MGLIECASGQSTWYGYEYFKNKKVASCKQISEGIFEGTVKGTNLYQTKIDINHPRSSICSCPFAKGRRIVCKHMIALYFKMFPEEAKKYIDWVDEQEEKYEQYQEELEERVKNYVAKLSKNQLQTELLAILFDGPDWQYDKFIREHRLDE